MIAPVRRSFLDALPARLADALSADELDHATRPLDGAGITRHSRAGSMFVDSRLVPDPLPCYMLQFDPPIDARDLLGAWPIESPVAVSPDVHQRTWEILAAGEELEDPYNKRIAATPFAVGRWQLLPRLTGRPEGELPGVVCGASPAYDMNQHAAAVDAIEIAPRTYTAHTMRPSDPDAQALINAMRAAQPAWRGSGEGWDADPTATFVVVYDGADPAAGAATVDAGDGVAKASQFCLVRGALFGAALLNVLEALAREAGFARLRLDSSVFLYGDDAPHDRCGYEVGPPYDGDADVDVWADKAL